MKQILVQKGQIILEKVPPPAISANEVLVRTEYSVISTGTELSGLSMSRESLISRALKQPHNVKKALKMASEKGILKTYKIIKGLLDFGTPTGYSLAGEVLEVGASVRDLKRGDLVACSGAGVANHAEAVAVPRLLVSRIPDGLDMKEAASVTLGAIAMQGVRQAGSRLGETVAVIGLGLLGQLTCQLLRAAGARVIGIDIDAGRMDLARTLGAEVVLAPSEAKKVHDFTDSFGADATIITASTDSDEPLASAMEVTRRKGTVVVVGAVGLNLKRQPWYEKEIDLKISCSYGPGRYDASYEEEMLDYPYPYVRWTENRNMEEYLKLLSEGRVSFTALSPEVFEIEDAVKAYEQLKEKRPLAVLLHYSASKKAEEKKTFLKKTSTKSEGKIRLAVIGAGSFAATTHIPNLEKLHKEFHLSAVVSKHGTTAKQFAKNNGAEYCTTDYEEVLKDKNIDAVLIATRHHMHAKLTIEALKAGKHVFVEKPLAVNEEELSEIKKFFDSSILHPHSSPLLMVGFNRRFSPYAKRIKELTAKRRNPLLVHYRVNAGYLPLDHWTQKPEEGGRIIGEACHFLDLFQYWTGASKKSVSAHSIHPKSKDVIGQDNMFATITYDDGSVCNLLYTALGPRDLPKESCEVFWDGNAAVLDDYRSLTVKGGAGKGFKTMTQDKGHFAELEAFAEGIRSGVPPIPLEDLFAVTELSFEIDGMVR